MLYLHIMIIKIIRGDPDPAIQIHQRHPQNLEDVTIYYKPGHGFLLCGVVATVSCIIYIWWRSLSLYSIDMPLLPLYPIPCTPNTLNTEHVSFTWKLNTGHTAHTPHSSNNTYIPHTLNTLNIPYNPNPPYTHISQHATHPLNPTLRSLAPHMAHPYILHALYPMCSTQYAPNCIWTHPDSVNFFLKSDCNAFSLQHEIPFCITQTITK